MLTPTADLHDPRLLGCALSRCTVTGSEPFSQVLQPVHKTSALQSRRRLQQSGPAFVIQQKAYAVLSLGGQVLCVL